MIVNPILKIHHNKAASGIGLAIERTEILTQGESTPRLFCFTKVHGNAVTRTDGKLKGDFRQRTPVTEKCRLRGPVSRGQ